MVLRRTFNSMTAAIEFHFKGMCNAVMAQFFRLPLYTSAGMT
jgi:hypothetical protein